MVYMIGILKYPPSSAEAGILKYPPSLADAAVGKEFDNLYQEGKPAKQVLGLVSAEEGFEIISVWKVTGDYLEASQEVTKLYLAVSENIKGSTFTIRTYLSVMEALPIIGMSPPT